MRTLKLLAPALALLACACAHNTRVDWISVGPSFPPKPVEQVEVVQSYDELQHQAGAIGEMKGDSLPYRNDGVLNEQARIARRLAAQHGADAVVIKRRELVQESAPTSDSAPTPPQYCVYARAIKYVHNLTDQEKEIIRKWTPQTLNDLRGEFDQNMLNMGGHGGRR